jgi:hypothetical protein
MIVCVPWFVGDDIQVLEMDTVCLATAMFKMYMYVLLVLLNPGVN